MLETVVQDIRHSLRVFRRQPAFGAIALITLALGIGASTALFSVIDAALLRPLPYSHPEQLVDVLVEMPQRDGRVSRFAPSLDDVDVWRQSAPVFSHIAAWRAIAPDRVVDGEEPIRVRAAEISASYLPLLGAVPHLGRGVNEADEMPGAPAVVMLGHAFWQRRFGGDPNALMSTLRFDGEPVTVVGIAAPSFRRDVAVFRPLVKTGLFKQMRGSGGSVVGRLLPTVPMADAQKILTATLPAMRDPARPAERGSVLLRSQLETAVASYRQIVITMTSAIGLILLLACVNVAALLLARGAARQTEVAVRSSLGASRWRLVRQLLTESLVLSLLGGILGVAIAWFTLETLVANLPLSLSPDVLPRLNPAVLGASLTLTVLTGLLFGLVPALRLSGQSINAALMRGGRQPGIALTRRGSQALIAIEVALAVVMLAGAGLMIRSFSRLLSVDLGFEPARFLALEAMPVDNSPGVLAEYYPTLLRQIRALPGVEAAGAINHAPLMGTSTFTFATVPGGRSASVTARQILPGYFETVGLPLKSGRFMTDADLTSVEKPLLVNATAARTIFPDTPAVGRQLQIGKTTRTIIGVVGDIRANGPMRAPAAEVYFSFEPPQEKIHQAFALTVLVAPRGDGSTLPAELRRIAASLGTRVVIDRVRSGSELYSEYVGMPRRRTVMLSIFGGFGLLLAIVGVAGMTSYAVARRTREIGVRIAFGARAGQVVRTMLIDAVWPIAAGVAIGLGGAWLSTGVIKSFLFETTPTDPETLAAVVTALAVAACVAAWVPAWRAARVDPISALRAE